MGGCCTTEKDSATQPQKNNSGNKPENNTGNKRENNSATQPENNSGNKPEKNSGTNAEKQSSTVIQNSNTKQQNVQQQDNNQQGKATVNQKNIQAVIQQQEDYVETIKVDSDQQNRALGRELADCIACEREQRIREIFKGGFKSDQIIDLGNYSSTPLMVAIAYKKVAIVPPNNDFALLGAVASENPEIVSMLLAFKVNTKLANRSGQNALQLAQKLLESKQKKNHQEALQRMQKIVEALQQIK